MKSTQAVFLKNKYRHRFAAVPLRASLKRPATLPVIPGLLLATTGLMAPGSVLAQETPCVSESSGLCAESKTASYSVRGSRLSSSLPSDGAASDVVINNNDEVVLSADDTISTGWANVKSLTVGSTTDGALTIDGQQIQSATGSIGRGSTGSVRLTNGAKWVVGTGNLVLGTNNGDGRLLVEKGSQISGIKEFRIGEYNAGAKGKVVIDGNGSSVSTGWAVVGDQGEGTLDILNGGQLFTTQHMNIGYIGKTNLNNLKGNGVVNVDGAGSLLEVGTSLLLGGHQAATNDAKGMLTVSNGATVTASSYIWVGIGTGSTGVVNIGARQGEAAQQAGYIETPLLFLGDTKNHDGTALLNFNHNSDDYALSARIYGYGEVNHEGPGTTLLSGVNNTWTGNTTVSNGTLRAGSTTAFSANSDFTVGSGGTLDLNGYSQQIKSLSLAGTLSFGSPDSGRDDLSLAGGVLTVSGDYIGDNGLLILNAAEDEAQQKGVVNQLHVKGDTSGATRVRLNALGTASVSDLNGARVVQVDGASEGEFVADGRLVAGAYDYALLRGAQTEGAAIPDSNHWYLTNTWTPEEEPQPDVDPLPQPAQEPEADPEDTPAPAAQDPEQPDPQVDPDPAVKPASQAVYRPEAGAYLANKMAANTLFSTRLYDRLGETEYIDPLTGETKVTSLWLRNVGGHTRFRDSSGQLRTQSNRYVVQLGGDLAQWSSTLADRWHLGVMVGYANSQSNTRSNVSHYQADGTVSGYSAGLYGTWFADEADKSGSYVDLWMLYNWFDNTVKGEQIAEEKYRSRGVTASVEVGHAFKLAEKPGRSYWVQPQAQLTWMGVSADEHREANGTRIHDDDKGNLQSRLGVKAYLRGHAQRDEGTGRLFQPFVEANWLHNTRNYAISMSETRSEVDGARNLAELRAGVEAKVNTRLHLWGNVGQQIGDNGYSDTQAVLGLKVLF